MEARRIEENLSKAGNWKFRRKQRLDPSQSEFQSLHAWLEFMHSDEGARNAGGGITRYAGIELIDSLDLVNEVIEMARIFRPLMESIVPGAREPADLLNHLIAMPRAPPPSVRLGPPIRLVYC